MNTCPDGGHCLNEDVIELAKEMAKYLQELYSPCVSIPKETMLSHAYELGLLDLEKTRIEEAPECRCANPSYPLSNCSTCGGSVPL